MCLYSFCSLLDISRLVSILLPIYNTCWNFLVHVVCITCHSSEHNTASDRLSEIYLIFRSRGDPKMYAIICWVCKFEKCKLKSAGMVKPDDVKKYLVLFQL